MQKSGANPTSLTVPEEGRLGELGCPEERAWAQRGHTKGTSLSALPLPDCTDIETLCGRNVTV